MSRRDEVWEMKRQRFLAKQGSGFGNADPVQERRRVPPHIKTDVSSSMVVEAPTSPLAELMQQGYPATGAPRGQPEYAAAQVNSQLPSYGSRGPPGLPRSGSRQDGFDADIAQQWSGNVQRSIEQHQQQNDPNYRGVHKKPQGYRVSHAPGGGSSISLSWGGDAEPAAAARGRGGAGNRAPSPSHAAAAATGQRAPSPSYTAAGRAAQRSQSPFSVVGQAQVLGGGPGSDVAAGGRAGPQSYAANSRPPPFGSDADAAYGGGGGRESGVGYGRPPVPRSSSREGGMRGGMGMPNAMGMPHGMGMPNGSGMPDGFGSNGGFGARVDNRSSNAFACGANQNTGNYVSDRRTTRVARAPGGGSSIMLG